VAVGSGRIQVCLGFDGSETSDFTVIKAETIDGVLFVTDLTSGALTHDGCPITNLHVGNARKLAKPGDRYILGKPSQAQKIDAAVTSVLAHEAAADARLAGWGKPEPSRKVFVFR
jgi:hypothetical protein